MLYQDGRVEGRTYDRELSIYLHGLLFYFFSNYLPLHILTLKTCNHDISKSITTRSFKLGQLIEDDE